MLIHNYFQNAIAGLIADLSIKLEPYSAIIQQDFPIYILNTGDETFLSSLTDSSEINQTTITTKVPRMVGSPSGITINSDQLTNRRVTGHYSGINDIGVKQQYVNDVRVIPLTHTVDFMVVFENITQYYQFIEIMLITLFRTQKYTFYFADMRCSASYTLPDGLDSSANLDLGFNDESRQRELEITLELRMNYPAFNVYGDGIKTNLDKDNTIKEIRHNTNNCEPPITQSVVFLPSRDDES